MREQWTKGTGVMGLAQFVTMLSMLLAAAGTSLAQSADPRFAEVDARLEALVQRHALPGAVLLVAQDGAQVYARAVGSYTLDQRMPIASASKWLSATVLARLVDQGRLDWDAPISRYGPDVPADKRSLTVRQLFALTSGIPGGDLNSAVSCLGNRFTTLEACARQILDLPLRASPGTTFDYGGHSMQVAGWIAEKATGEDWNRLFRRELAAPLGMVDTDFGLLRGVDVGNPRIAGGVFSTAPDYLKLLQLHLDDGRKSGMRLLDPATVAELRDRQTRDSTIFYTAYPQAVGYAIGHWVEAEAADGHSERLSSPGAFGFWPWIDTRRKIAGVLAVQGSYATQTADTRALIAAVQAALDKDIEAVPFADFGGLWWSPAEAGSGMTLVHQANGALLASWYTFDDAGERAWFYATGRWLASDRWSGTLARADYTGVDALRGGVVPSSVSTAAVGTLELIFSSGSRGQWRFRIGEVERTIAIERFPPLPGN